MQAFYSSVQQWPLMVQTNPWQMEGGSPLEWSMLYPPLATACLQTYAWEGHLANLMPWMTSQQAHDTRPSLISHAMWNTQQEPIV